MKKISFSFNYLITKYDWCFYFIPNLAVWKPYNGVCEISVGFLLWELDVRIRTKKKIKVYMAALQSLGSFGVYTLDDVYCFPTKEKRDDWRDTLDANTGVDITYLEDEMEVDL